MASSKKSLSDKFALESKQKSPGKKSKKSKVSKSLSRELTPSSPSSTKKKAQKSSSDSLVGSQDRDKDVKTSFSGPGPSEVGRGKKLIDDKTRPLSSGSVHDSIVPVHFEKLDTSLKATWKKPDDDSVFLDSSESTSSASFVTPNTSQTITTTIESPPNKSNPESTLMTSPFLVKLTHSSPVVDSVKSCDSVVSSCYSSDSLASEMESYRLGSSSIASDGSSDVDTVRNGNNTCDQIDIGECSSSSTPIKFGLYDDHKEHSIHRKHPPKFSLIREAAAEDLESMSLSSDYSPTTTTPSLKSIESRNRIDDFSDESDSSRMKESAEFSDDPDFHSHGHFVPLNKQLQIVTSMDRLMDRSPRRRSHSPPKLGEQGFHHHLPSRLSFVDFMRCNGLSTHLYYLPADMTLEKFR
ncbi:hypothetical protein ACF0H5_004267 [Mactra antiquata]